MRLTTLIVFSGIALTSFPAASATLCPTLEGYPDCPWSDNAARAFNQGNLEAAKAAVPAKSHHRY